jgi:hypothetical protein
MINYKIKGYLDKLKNNVETNKKEFNDYAENIKIFDNIKFINYTKPKPLKVKDKECASIIRIKRQLFPCLNTLNKIDIKKIRKKGRKKYINLKNISNQNIDLNISKDIDNLKSPTNDKNIIEKDSLKLINNLANEGKNLSFKLSKTANKVDSLIDINLPHPTIYEQIIKKNKENNKRNSRNINNDKDSINDINISDTNLLSKKKLEKIINLFKKEVGKIKNYKNYDFSNIDDKNLIRNNLIYPLNLHINKIKKYCEDNQKDINRINFNISSRFLANKKLKRKNRNCLSNNREQGNNLYNNSKNNDSFSIFYKNRYNQSYNSYSYD